MSTYYVAGLPYSSELYHHGIKGQKWGVRRFQNSDGTLTAAGKARYEKEMTREEGRREDRTAYKYNKPGESGWVGLGRKIKAEVIDPSRKKRVKKKEAALREKEAMRKEGQREDQMAYKYNKPGESGWIGLGRKIKAEVIKPVANKMKPSKKPDDYISSGKKAVKMGIIGISAGTAVNAIGKELTASGSLMAGAILEGLGSGVRVGSAVNLAAGGASYGVGKALARKKK